MLRNEHNRDVYEHAAVYLQRVIRGYLTRRKLCEAREVYESIFNDIEDDNFQIGWEYNSSVCWPTATLSFVPNQRDDNLRPLNELGSKDDISSELGVPQQGCVMKKTMASIDSLLSEFADFSTPLDSLESLLNEIAGLSCPESRSAAEIKPTHSDQSVTPKACSSQPTLGSEKHSITASSHSSPTLDHYDCSIPIFACVGHKHHQNTPCKLCQRINNEKLEPIVQSLRSKSRRCGIWLPSGVPAKRVDGTMHRQFICYKSKPYPAGEHRGGKTTPWLQHSKPRLSRGLDHCRVFTPTRTTSKEVMSAHGVLHNWPKSGVQSVHKSPIAEETSSITSSQRASPTDHSCHQPGTPDSPRTLISPLMIDTTTSPRLATCIHSHSDCNETSSPIKHGVQTAHVHTDGEPSLEACTPTVLHHAAVQTVSDMAVQTDDIDCENTSRLVSTPVQAVDAERSGLLPKAATHDQRRGWHHGESPAESEAVTESETVTESDEQLDEVTVKSRVEETRSVLPAEDVNPGTQLTTDNGHPDLTTVTPLSSPGIDSSQSFLPHQGDSSTPVHVPAAQRHNADRAGSPVVSGRTSGTLPAVGDTGSVTSQTSLWEESTLAKPTTPTEIKSDATQEELKSLKQTMSMELLWIEQAIASRKQYLSLVKDMAEGPSSSGM